MDDLISRKKAMNMKFSRGINEDGLLFVPYRDVKAHLESLPPEKTESMEEVLDLNDRIVKANEELIRVNENAMRIIGTLVDLLKESRKERRSENETVHRSEGNGEDSYADQTM